jgi:hypothetical protein
VKEIGNEKKEKKRNEMRDGLFFRVAMPEYAMFLS